MKLPIDSQKEKGGICRLGSQTKIANHIETYHRDNIFSHENQNICLDIFLKKLSHNHETSKSVSFQL